VILTVILMTRPLPVYLQRECISKSAHRRSNGSTVPYAASTFIAILPPPDEPPPPPPPGEDSSSDSFNKPVGDLGSWRSSGFDEEGRSAERVLKLPQVLSPHCSLVPTENREHRSNPF
jgi:hypothetical protein